MKTQIAFMFEGVKYFTFYGSNYMAGTFPDTNVVTLNDVTKSKAVQGELRKLNGGINWNMTPTLINEHLSRNRDVIADATHLNAASRNKLINCITAPNVNIHVVWIKTTLETCLKQNELRKGTRAYVPPSVITKMHNSIEKPEFEEGLYSICIFEENKQPVIIRKGN